MALRLFVLLVCSLLIAETAGASIRGQKALTANKAQQHSQFWFDINAWFEESVKQAARAAKEAEEKVKKGLAEKAELAKKAEESVKAAKKSEEAVKREAAKLTKEEEKTKAAAVAERAAAALKDAETFQAVYAHLAPIAAKYDCHMVENDLVTTLANVLEKNAEAGTRLTERCEQEKTDARSKRDAAIDQASLELTAAQEAARNRTSAAKKRANDDYEATIQQLAGEVAHATSVVGNAELNATKARADFTEAEKLWVSNKERVSSLRSIAKNDRADMHRVNSQALTDDIADLTATYNGAIDTAKNTQAASEARCQTIFTETNDAINADKKVVADVKGLMFKLTECVKYNDAKQGAPPAQTAAAALLEVNMEEVRCRDMQRELSALLRLKGARRNLLGAAPGVSGTVDDMERRIQEHIAAAVNARYTCVEKAATAFDKASRHASDNKAGEMTAAQKKFSDAEADAEQKKEEKLGEAAKLESANMKAFESATSTRDQVLDALAEAKRDLATAEQRETVETRNAEKARNEANSHADAREKEANAAAQQTFDTVQAAAIKDHNDVEKSITERCAAQQAFLGDEAGRVRQIQVKVDTIQHEAVADRATDCVGFWEASGSCSVTCGIGGKQTEVFVVRQEAKGGKSCKAVAGSEDLRREVGCVGPAPCPVDCKYSAWEPWAECSTRCGPGTQERSRTVEVEGAHGGKLCEDHHLFESKTCERKKCPVDCKMSPWSTWTDCSLTCNGGTQSRFQTVLQESAHQGKECPPTMDMGKVIERRECNAANCPVDCEVGVWRIASQCKACDDGSGQGTYRRERAVVQQPKFGGRACPALAEDIPCENVPRCPVDAVCKKGEWSKCDEPCGEGTRTRADVTVTKAKYGGKQCSEEIEREPCKIKECPVDCEVGKWSSWSKCDATGECGFGKQSRTRKVTTAAAHGGDQCPNTSETRQCGTKCQPVDCVKKWGYYGQCNVNCMERTQYWNDPSRTMASRYHGTKTRKEEVAVPAKHGGQCSSLQTQSANCYEKKDKQCMWKLETWIEEWGHREGSWWGQWGGWPGMLTVAGSGSCWEFGKEEYSIKMKVSPLL